MNVSDFPGELDVLVRDSDNLLKIRKADLRVAVSQVLADIFDTYPGASWNSTQLVIAGVDRDNEPCQVTYRAIGFDPTSNPEANEGGFHLLERICPPSPDAIEQEQT